MQTISEFTIEDLVKESSPDYAYFEGENRVFMIFDPISPEMMKLKEDDKFIYKSETYRIKMRIPEGSNHPGSIQFNCLKIGKGSV